MELPKETVRRKVEALKKKKINISFNKIWPFTNLTKIEDSYESLLPEKELIALS